LRQCGLGTGSLNSSGIATVATTLLPAGTDSVTATYSDTEDPLVYKSSTSAAVTETVNKANSTTTLTSSANPSLFGQTVTFSATVAAASPGSGTPTGTVTFKDGTTTVGTATLSSGSASYATSSLSTSTHSITVSYGGDGNFNSSTSSTLTQTVNKATPTITWSNPANIAYGTALNSTQLNATASVAGTLTYSPASGSVRHAGNGQSLTVSFVPTDTTDYNNASKSVTINVTAVALTISADNKSKAYGAALPTLTASYSGFVNGDTSASLTTQPTLSTTATVSSHVSGNPYSISASGGVDSDYSISYAAGTLTVTAVNLTITADNKTKAYGAALPTLTASYSGFVNGDSSASLATQPSLSTTATASSHVSGNPYSISASGAADSDYTISYAAGTLTVTAVALTITADNKTKVYGGAVPTLTASYSGFVNGDSSASLATQPSLSTTATASSHVSGNPYSISASGAADSDYSISYAAGTLTVTAVNLTITADNQTKAYGAALPTLTASYSGFVNGDSSTSLATQPSLSTTATASSHVSGNPYSISASGAADSDYTISYAAGNLTVTAVNLTITADNQTKAYGAALPTLTASYSGFVNSDTAASLQTRPTLSTVATQLSSVGGSPYDITASGAVDSDYTITYVKGQLTVTAAAPTVTINDDGGVYNASPYPATGTVAGVSGVAGSSLEGVGLTVSYFDSTNTELSSAPANVGSYTATAVFAGSADYAYASDCVSFTITAATPTVTVSDPSGVYTGNPHAATGTVAGVDGVAGSSLEGIPLTVSYYDAQGNLLGGAPTYVGSYKAEASFPGSDDYNSATASKNFSITVAAASIYIPSMTGPYTGNPFLPNATIAGVDGN